MKSASTWKATGDAARFAIGDPTSRVYARFSDVPDRLKAKLRREAAEEARSTYEAKGPGEAAAVLRRSWSLDHDLSWKILLELDYDNEARCQRTHILVLREVWADAMWTHHHLPIGERLLVSIPGNGIRLDGMKIVARYGAWREWRSRVWQWVQTFRPTARKAPRIKGEFIHWFDPVLGEQKTTTHEFEAFIVSLWPQSGVKPPSEREVREVIRRIRAFMYNPPVTDPRLWWLLRDELATTHCVSPKSLGEWEIQTTTDVSSGKNFDGMGMLHLRGAIPECAGGPPTKPISLGQNLRKLRSLRKVKKSS